MGFEVNLLVFGVGGGSYDCCQGSKMVHVKYVKICYGPAVNAGIGASKVPKKCNGLRKGDWMFGAEVGAGAGVVGAEAGFAADISSPN